MVRISADVDDPGYVSRETARRAIVLLNGVEVRDCVTADEDRGEVLMLKRDVSGRLLHENGECLRETKRGAVRILLDAR